MRVISFSFQVGGVSSSRVHADPSVALFIFVGNGGKVVTWYVEEVSVFNMVAPQVDLKVVAIGASRDSGPSVPKVILISATCLVV